MSPDPTGAPAAAAGPWAAFVRKHLFDYAPAATRLWLLIVACGLGALGHALWGLAHGPSSQWLPVLAGLGLVGLAAAFPVNMPRSKNTVSVADVFVFTLLATLGAPAAILASGLDGLMATLRTSKRLSSRLSGPSCNLFAMAACGAAMAWLSKVLGTLGLNHDVANLAALCLAAPLHVLLTTAPLMTMISRKTGKRLRWGDWWDSCTWIIAMATGSAFLAGLLSLNAQRYGVGMLVVAAAVVIGLVLLLRATVSRQERERSAQEAQVTAAQQQAALSQQRFTAAFTHAAIGMAVVQPDGTVLQANQALCALMERSEASLIGTRFGALLHHSDATLLQRQVDGVVQRNEGAFSMELRCPRDEAGDLWVAVHCSRYDSAQGDGACLIFQVHDITSRHLAESRLHHIAFHDDLTDLANRHCFHERLEVAVERTRLDATQRFAVMFMDLDRFKMVNDSLGHNAGNELLQHVAKRLREGARPCDLVARLGGDEFAVLLEAVHAPDDALRMAHAVLGSLKQPLTINGTEVLPGASVGITFSDLGYRTVDEVLRDADLAMYEAKAKGRGRVVLFDHSMHERVAEKLALENDLRHAIGEGQLTVHFQPMYELEPYRLCGFESLARWEHPTRGAISPEVFIALAEESGHIESLTDWVIDHSLAQLARWQEQVPSASDLGLHVNISTRDLARADLVATVHAAMQRHGTRPGALTLEITETTLMGKLDQALPTMQQLRALGVRFSIDDFGTGYSSLAYLGTLPIDSLKIDRSFVMGLSELPQNVEIVRAVQTLGASLGRKVIAEGIETAEQLGTLRGLGVDVGQGFLLGMPMRADHVDELLSVATHTATV